MSSSSQVPRSGFSRQNCMSQGERGYRIVCRYLIQSIPPAARSPRSWLWKLTADACPSLRLLCIDLLQLFVGYHSRSMGIHLQTKKFRKKKSKRKKEKIVAPLGPNSIISQCTPGASRGFPESILVGSTSWSLLELPRVFWEYIHTLLVGHLPAVVGPSPFFSYQSIHFLPFRSRLFLPNPEWALLAMQNRPPEHHHTDFRLILGPRKRFDPTISRSSSFSHVALC